MVTTIEKISNTCLQCLATAKLPKAITEDTTTIPMGIGTAFSSDILERHQQRIMLTKEDLTHYATAVILPDQTVSSLRQGLVQTIAPLINSRGGKVRTDNAPGFQSIAASQDTDVILTSLKLKIDLGDALNPNRNPIAEAGISELKRELLKLTAQDAPLDQALLSLAVKNLNNRVRSGGQSASERLHQRDQLTNKPLIVEEKTLKEEMTRRRSYQHERKNEKLKTEESTTFAVGDLVMMKTLSKLDRARDLFIVAKVEEDGHLRIRKSQKKWLKRTYRVKPGQVVKVFNSKDDDSEKKKVINSKETNGRKEIHPNREAIYNPPTGRLNRQAKSRANITLQQQKNAGLIAIFRTMKRKKKMEEKPRYVEIIQIHEEEDVISWVESPFPPLDWSNVTNDYNETETTSSTVKANVSEDSKRTDSENETSNNTAVTSDSMITMTDTYRAILDYQFIDDSSSQSSLSWDNNETSTALENPLDRDIIFEQEETGEDLYEDAQDMLQQNNEEEERRSSSPNSPVISDEVYRPRGRNSEPDDSSPARTRSRSNPDVRIGSTSSSIDIQENQFQRDAQLRRPVTPRPARRPGLTQNVEDEGPAAQDDAAQKH